MQRYRIAVGHAHGVKPGNIVGAIANEAGIDSKHIGRIEIHDHYSTLDLPEGMPRDTMAVLKKVRVAGQRLDAVAYGENADDAIRPDRPGARAASDHLVLRPLAAIGLTKIDVRLLARELGLSVAEKPAAPCLASRIPHGQEVTPEKLRQVELAETSVRALGFSDLRVRHHGEIARLERLGFTGEIRGDQGPPDQPALASLGEDEPSRYIDGATRG